MVWPPALISRCVVASPARMRRANVWRVMPLAEMAASVTPSGMQAIKVPGAVPSRGDVFEGGHLRQLDERNTNRANCGAKLRILPPTTTHRNWLGTPIGFNLIGFAVNSRRWLFARPLLQRRTAWSALHRQRWRLLLEQLPKIAVIEKKTCRSCSGGIISALTGSSWCPDANSRSCGH
jgi:hypothetical protein